MPFRILFQRSVDVRQDQKFCMAIIPPSHPSSMELCKRECGDVKECCFCGYKTESIEHLFIKCWWSKAFWAKLEVIAAPEDTNENITQWLSFQGLRGGAEYTKKVIVGAWVIWKNRNAVVHRSVDEAVLMTNSYIQQFKGDIIMQYSSFNEPDVIRRNIWTILSDGAWCKLSGRAGFAAVAMREDQIILCNTGWADNCCSPGEAEMRGCPCWSRDCIGAGSY